MRDLGCVEGDILCENLDSQGESGGVGTGLLDEMGSEDEDD